MPKRPLQEPVDVTDALATGDPVETADLPPGRIHSGVRWLDIVLNGGIPENRVCLVVGEPGTGKTTLGLQFLCEGAKRGEPVLYISLAETREELIGVARSHEFDLKGVEVFELLPEGS